MSEATDLREQVAALKQQRHEVIWRLSEDENTQPDETGYANHPEVKELDKQIKTTLMAAIHAEDMESGRE